MDREHQLDQIIVTYLEAVEAGQTPDRQEWLARYPELAPELAAFFADEDQFDSLVAPLRVTPSSSGLRRPGSALPSTIALAPNGSRATSLLESDQRCFGDYELIEEIARGGMGVVYQARQISLNRVVALKMIRNGQLAGPEEVQRFRLEAEAAANLDHAHIVPIYDVGESDGHHYFSMKLIRGGNLAQRLADFRLPACDPGTGKASRGRTWSRSDVAERKRQIARLLASVARAVAYAHQRGLLHRDLKPANILVDAAGQPHVTDFGLAKRVSGFTLAGPADGAVSLTQSGIAVGTPNYMAPEQAAGPKQALTTAADVYSLGAILYELLTGRPPFKAETPLETLVEVLEREPVRPRLLNPWVDRDLETVCLKCLDKDPARRYASASALADDLERFLAGEPILARPISNWERGRRWCRRNPALALVSGLAILALLTVAMFSSLYAASESSRVRDLRRQQQEMERTQARMRAALLEARQARARAQTALKAARRHAREANQQRRLAEARFWQAHRAVGDLCIRLGEDRLHRFPGLQPLRKELLETGLKYYEDFLKQKGNDARLRQELATTQFRAAFITNVVGSKTQALASYQKALAHFEDLLRANPADVRIQADVARTYLNLGTLQSALGQEQKALESYLKSRDLHARLVKTCPRAHEFQSGLARCLTNLGVLYRPLGRLADSLEAFRRALALHQELVRKVPRSREYQSGLAISHVNMGVMDIVLGQDREGLQSYQQAWAIQKKLAAEDPHDLNNQNDLALSYQRIGNRLCNSGNRKEGLTYLRKGLDLFKQLARANASVTEFCRNLARCNTDLGQAYLNGGNTTLALKHYQDARGLREQIARRHAGVWPFQSDLASSYYRLGLVQDKLGHKTEAARFFHKARLLQEETVAANRDNLHYRGNLSRTLRRLARLLAGLGRQEQALAILRQAVDHLSLVVERSPQLTDNARELLHAYLFLADLEAQRGWPGAGRRPLEQALAVARRFTQALPRNEWLQCDLSDTLLPLGRLYLADHLFDRAHACFHQALAIRSRQTYLSRKNPHLPGALAESCFELARLQEALGRPEVELRCYQQTRATLERLVRTWPDQVFYRGNLALAWHSLGVAYAGRGRHSEGAEALRKAIEHERIVLARVSSPTRSRKALANHYRTLAWILRGDHKPAEAVAAALEAQKLSSGDPQGLFLAGSSLALAAQAAGQGKTALTPAERAERDRYSALAVEALRQAVAAGFRDLKRLRDNPELALLRDREDFKALLAQLPK